MFLLRYIERILTGRELAQSFLGSIIPIVVTTSLLIMAIPSTGIANSDLKGPKLRYCVGIEIDLNPFRVMKDPQELYYELLVTRSFISSNKDELGLLDSWYFSPNGKKFRAKISNKSLWNDGTKLSSRDAAFAIAKGLSFRPLGKKVRVVGTENINSPGWMHRSYEGIQIISEDIFELTFASEIENLTGVLKEALSSNSRHNRLWPVKLKDFDSGRKLPDVISKFPLVVTKNGELEMNVFGRSVSLVSKNRCEGADFFPGKQNFRGDSGAYKSTSSRYPQVVLAFINTSKESNRSVERRKAISSFLRQITSNALETDREIAHFKNQEPGFVPKLSWTDIDNSRPNVPSSLIITSSSVVDKDHPFRVKMLNLAKQQGSKLSWIDSNINDYAPENVDAIIWFSRLETDRQIWTQDILGYSMIRRFLSNSPNVLSSLEVILQKSAATIPVDNVTLQNLELKAFEEVSVVPIARMNKKVLSRKGLPIELAFTEQDEFTFIWSH